MRYIDADTLYKKMTREYKKHYAGTGKGHDFTIAMEMVRNHPTSYDVGTMVMNAILRNFVGWIPCEERLPEDNGEPVMATTINGDLLIAIYEPEEGLWWASDYDGAIYDVVAWMPLPEPYGAEKGE